MAVRKSSSAAKAKTASYQHPDAKALIRPEAGAQTRFTKKKPAATYRYDSSLAPELVWDDQKVRDEGEGHLALEFSNTTPLPAKIYANEGACQFLFLQGNEPCETSYGDRSGKYMGQRGVTLPRL